MKKLLSILFFACSLHGMQQAPAANVAPVPTLQQLCIQKITEALANPQQHIGCLQNCQQLPPLLQNTVAKHIRQHHHVAPMALSTAMSFTRDTRLNTSAFKHAAFNKDSSLILTTSHSGEVIVWSARFGFPVARLIQSSVVAATFSNDGTKIATLSASGNIRILQTPAAPTEKVNSHNVATLEPLNIFSWKKNISSTAQNGYHFSLHFSRDDKQLLATSTAFSCVDIFDSTTGENKTTLNNITNLRDVFFSPDGTSIILATNRTPLPIWHTATQDFTYLTADQPAGSDFLQACLSGDGATIAFADNRKITLYDTQTKTQKASFNIRTNTTLPVGCVHSITFSPDNSMLAVSITDKHRLGNIMRIKIWTTDPNTKEWRESAMPFIKNTDAAVHNLAFSRDSKQLMGLQKSPSQFAPAPCVQIWNVIDLEHARY